MTPELGLQLAAAYAKQHWPDVRNFRLGAVGMRHDGVIVYARNGSGLLPTPDAHAEARLIRKLDLGADVYVARILKDNRWANARPCGWCLNRLQARNVRRVYFTSSGGEYSCLRLRP